MRIDAFNSANAALGAQTAEQVRSTVSSRSTVDGSADRTTLSSDSVSISALATKALASPTVRQETVHSIRQAIESGGYELNPTEIARAMTNESRG